MTTHEDRCVGALLGCAVGDILGANLEFKSRAEIQAQHGIVRDFLGSEKRPLGMFTDDTEMTLALAEGLVCFNGIDARSCAEHYAFLWANHPRRGYGPSAYQSLEALNTGADYRATGRLVHPDGSYGNGGAMRIAPVGLAFRHADDVVMMDAVKAALLCTHVHPEAIDAAFVQAYAIGRLATANRTWSRHMGAFIDELQAVATAKAVYDAIYVAWMHKGVPDDDFLERVCIPNQFGARFQIRGSEALACALWCFINHPDDPEECVIRAANLGGDADTVAAMAGALAGALHGFAWIPTRWYDAMENDAGIGRDYLVDMAKRLSRLDLTTAG